MIPVGAAVHVFVVSSHVTDVVQVSPQLYVDGEQVPAPLHWSRVQNRPPPSGPASAAAPHAVPVDAKDPQNPDESHFAPQIGSPPEVAAHFPPGSVPGAAAVHVPTEPATAHD